MGGTYYSKDDYTARTTMRSTVASTLGIDETSATFKRSYDIKTGAIAAEVHPSLEPHGVKIRESRDSVAHPVTVPVIITLDTTGSMLQVPVMIQKALTKLMGAFLDDKVSGKKYLGDGYPAILISAVDDYDAQRRYNGEHAGTLQVGQFESGIEIDDNLTNLWLTDNGGGTYEESYDLALYFASRHTAHDHLEKRGRKGYMFIIGDEHMYPVVSKKQVKDVIGDSIQADIPVEEMLKEAQEKYHVFFILPNMTNHYHDEKLYKYWQKLLGQQNTLKLDDPSKICELIVSAVALCEENVGVDDLGADLGIDAAMSKSLVPLSLVAREGAVDRVSAAGLPAVAGKTSGIERL